MMLLSLALYLGLLFHLVGDYLTQTDWMAQQKTKSLWVALLHGSIYAIPFWWITGDHLGWYVLWGSHILIDRYRLAVYWIKLVNWNWSSTNFGYAEDKPAWMAVWLMIIVDNTFHILINSACIYWAF